MRRFVVRRNIERYRELLRSEINDERRRVLRTLLAEEENKLAAMTPPPEEGASPASDVPQPDEPDRRPRKPT